MTMPHLMNCPHSPDSWCLTCVKELWEEKNSIEERLDKFLVLNRFNLATIISRLEALQKDFERTDQFFKDTVGHPFALE